MRLTVNGKPREVDTDATAALGVPLLALLESFDVNPRLVAVAINGDVIPKGDFKVARVHADDAIEIVRMVGGGCACHASPNRVPEARR
jgi:thiamine biosynthesis protein ThiS